MLTFFDSNYETFNLTELVGRGGEGAVYHCENNPDLVAKIYHKPVTAEKAEKLRWMAENKDDKILAVAAWVVDVLFDKPDGAVVGFLMPNVRAKEIHELSGSNLAVSRPFSDKSCPQFLPFTSG